MKILAIIALLTASAFGQVTYGGTVTLAGSFTGGTSTSGTGCGAGYSSGPFEFKFIRAVNSNQTNFPIKIVWARPTLCYDWKWRQRPKLSDELTRQDQSPG
jgi:hypothetical protein